MITARMDFHIDELINQLDAYEQSYWQLVNDSLKWFGEEVTQAMKIQHPYHDRTGHLTSTIGYEFYEWANDYAAVTVYALADYAEEVEFGTVHARPYPYYWPKMYEFLPQLIDRIQLAANGLII